MRAVSAAASRRSPLTLLALCATTLYLAYEVVRFFTAPLGWDQSWLLYAAQQVLAGVKLYGPHLIETNPPLIVWFCTLPVLLAKALHLSPACALRLVTLGVILVSVGWSVRLTRARAETASPRFLCWLACTLLVVAFDLSTDDFGQREHLFVYLALPYLLAAGSGVAGRLSGLQSIALGISAGLAICIKPQEATVFVALELSLALRSKSLGRLIAPEVLTLIATCALYLLAIELLTPRYIRDLLPVLVDTYWAFGEGGAVALAMHAKRYLLELLLTLLACLLLRRWIKLPNVAVPLSAASVGAYAAFELQHTHWQYHRYPFQALLEIAWLFLALPLLRRICATLPQWALTEWALTAAVLLGMGFLTPSMIRRTRALIASKPPPLGDALCSVLAQYSPGERVSLLSMSLRDFSCVYQDRLAWASRFPHLFMLPAIVKNQPGPNPPGAPFKRLSADELQRLSGLQRSETAEDLEYWRPTAVVVEHCRLDQPCQAIPGRSFDVLSWFLQSPEFRSAWSHYQLQPARLPKYDIYARVH